MLGDSTAALRGVKSGLGEGVKVNLHREGVRAQPPPSKHKYKIDTFVSNKEVTAAAIRNSVLSSLQATGGGGNVTLRHCETINTTLGAAHTTCLALKWLPTNQPDTYVLPAGFGAAAAQRQEPLAPMFTWHGFQVCPCPPPPPTPRPARPLRLFRLILELSRLSCVGSTSSSR